jgi:hypothetical protein
MNVSWKIVRFHLKETFSIAYGNYSHRDALLISIIVKTITANALIDYYGINLDDFTTKLQQVKVQLKSQNTGLPNFTISTLP